ncbi:MAG: transglutaminase domain-containing protein [Undibacterium sp.]|uniref:transglutaminase domain-containing protein n=1 Tax=Undibacterium sp. TaxID=1914977 RepID=UPI002726C494|nr:transglutaminase domain-containing protein [Undibacterium sp.]MDO8652835.1 transglutaminase domain-containing protein [Undibacterium sp.]
MRLLNSLSSVLTGMLMLASVTSSSALYAHDINVQQRVAIDAHALAATPDLENTSKSLATYLAQDLHTDSEKIRAIYRWISDRIEYDVEAFLSGREVAMNVEEVLKKRLSVCGGFASLFEELATNAGLEVKSISGYAKAYGSVQGTHFDKPNHVWNAIKIDGEWRMIDATWGAGYVKDGKYSKALSEAFFLVPPEQFVFSHLPAEDSWQLQHTPHLSQQEFESLPLIQSTFFYNNISASEAWETSKKADFSGSFVQTFDLPYHAASIQQAPLEFHLKLDHPYQFKIQTEMFEKIALVQSEQWVEMEKQEQQFSLNYSSQTRGQLRVMGKRFGEQDYTSLLAYELRP